MNDTPLARTGETLVAESGDARSLVMEWVQPPRFDDELKTLFVESGREDSFDRYAGVARLLAEVGAGAVLARTLEGQLAIYTSLLPRSFQDGPQSVRGALLTGLVVHPSFRDFWTPVNFLRGALQLIEEQGELDFLYADPGENGAAVFRAASFDLLGSLQNFVFPVVPGWSSYLRHEFPIVQLDAERLSWEAGADQLSALPHLDSGSAFKVIRTRALHESWIQANRTESSEWIVLRVPGRSGEALPAARVLLTPTSSGRTLGITDLGWDSEQVSVESLLYAITGHARSQGFRKLAIRTLRPSRLGQAMARSGFVGRSGEQPVLTRVVGEDTILPSPHRWLLTWVDGDYW
jgi:hypothetical protein